MNFHSKGLAFVEALEVSQAPSTTAIFRKVVGSQHLALDDGRVNLNLVEPREWIGQWTRCTLG